MKINFEVTARGFPIIEFKDHYGTKCNIQQSSLKSNSAIWFGVADPNPKINNDDGKGYVPCELPENIIISTRMYLTQKQVKELLPILKYFAKHGVLPYTEGDIQKN